MSWGKFARLLCVSVAALAAMSSAQAKKIPEGARFGPYVVAEIDSKSCDRSQEPERCAEFVAPRLYNRGSDDYQKINSVLREICPASINDLDAGKGISDKYECRVTFINARLLAVTSEIDNFPTQGGGMGGYERQFHLIAWRSPDSLNIADFFKDLDGLDALIGERFANTQGCAKDFSIPDFSEWMVTRDGVSLDCNQGYAKLFPPLAVFKWDELKPFLKDTDAFSISPR